MAVWYLAGGGDAPIELDLTLEAFLMAVRSEFPEAVRVEPHGLGPTFDLVAYYGLPTPVTWVNGLVVIEADLPSAAEVRRDCASIFRPRRQCSSCTRVGRAELMSARGTALPMCIGDPRCTAGDDSVQ